MTRTRYTTIDVTEADIGKAIKRESARCAVAVALARSLPGANKVAIDLQAIRFTLNGERHIYFTPPDAVGYIIAFDAGDDIHPFRFRLSEDHRLPATSNRPRTEAGLKRDRARGAVDTRKRQVERAERAVAEASTPVERETAVARLDTARATLGEAEASREQVLAEIKGEPSDVGDRKPRIPTTFKRGTRHYGQRALRVNKPDVVPEARENLTAAYDRWESPTTP